MAGILGIATYYKLTTSFHTSALDSQPTAPHNFAATVAPGPPLTAEPGTLVSHAALNPTKPSELGRIFAEFGFPGPVADLQYRQAYVASYNRQLRNANWVSGERWDCCRLN